MMTIFSGSVSERLEQIEDSAFENGMFWTSEEARRARTNYYTRKHLQNLEKHAEHWEFSKEASRLIEKALI